MKEKYLFFIDISQMTREQLLEYKHFTAKSVDCTLFSDMNGCETILVRGNLIAKEVEKYLEENKIYFEEAII